MISTADVQAAIITRLKANAPLVALVADEIREEQWMATGYTYPCARVHITRLAPVGIPGLCEDTSFTCDFDVSYRAADPSSKPAADGMSVAVAALIGWKPDGTGFVAESAVKLVDVAGPIPESEDAWMGRAFFNCKLQET